MSSKTECFFSPYFLICSTIYSAYFGVFKCQIKALKVYFFKALQLLSPVHKQYVMLFETVQFLCTEPETEP